MLTVLSAILGTAGFATIALAHAGVSLCARRIELGAPLAEHMHHHHHDDVGLFFGYGPSADALAVCPLVLAAAVVCATLCALALVALAAGRDRRGETWRATLQALARFSIGRLTAALALACALPILLGARGEAGSLVEAAIAVVSAIALSALIVFAARFATALARVLLVALIAHFRLRALSHGSRARLRGGAPSFARPALFARGHGTRAPPIAA